MPPSGVGCHLYLPQQFLEWTCSCDKLDGEVAGYARCARLVKPAFHDTDVNTDTDILAKILADTSDTRDFLKLFLWQAERHVDILATILARLSVSVSASWNASFKDMSVTSRACRARRRGSSRGCHEDTTWKTVLWNLSYTKHTA